MKYKEMYLCALEANQEMTTLLLNLGKKSHRNRELFDWYCKNASSRNFKDSDFTDDNNHSGFVKDDK